MAVVKADGYGHGAVPVARAAVDAGATALGVALVEEGVELRDAGLDVTVLLLSEPPPEAAAEVVARRLTPVVYTETGIDSLAKAVADQGAEPLPVHLKVDTGMHRVGAAVDQVPALVERLRDHRELRLAGVCTHLAVADEPERDYTTAQLERFARCRRRWSSSGSTSIRCTRRTRRPRSGSPRRASTSSASASVSTGSCPHRGSVPTSA